MKYMFAKISLKFKKEKKIIIFKAFYILHNFNAHFCAYRLELVYIYTNPINPSFFIDLWISMHKSYWICMIFFLHYDSWSYSCLTWMIDVISRRFYKNKFTSYLSRKMKHYRGNFLYIYKYLVEFQTTWTLN